MLLSEHWKDMVVHWAEQENYHLNLGDDDALVFLFGGPDRIVQITLLPQGRWINITATDDRYLREDQIPRAIGAANGWNSNFQRPSVAVVFPEGDGPAWLSLSLDMDSQAQYTEERFAVLVECSINALLKVFSWLDAEYGL
ncbi:hypothetical protein ACWCYZ_38115 [Streptomyces virginiae]